MSALAKTLSDYGEYHRDHRNVLTHAVGVPLIVLAVTTLLARPEIAVFGKAITPALVLGGIAAIYYTLLDFRFGMLMTLLLAAFLFVGHQIASVSTLAWLGGGVALFVVGWAFQFLGHHWEGRKPAFIDDIKSLLVGPLFMLAEGLFALGLAKGLKKEVEALD
ncbi:MAG: Mpo1-like protein [Alteraurantiacibacter sp.]